MQQVRAKLAAKKKSRRRRFGETADFGYRSRKLDEAQSRWVSDKQEDALHIRLTRELEPEPSSKRLNARVVATVLKSNGIS